MASDLLTGQRLAVLDKQPVVRSVTPVQVSVAEADNTDRDGRGRGQRRRAGAMVSCSTGSSGTTPKSDGSDAPCGSRGGRCRRWRRSNAGQDAALDYRCCRGIQLNRDSVPSGHSRSNPDQLARQPRSHIETKTQLTFVVQALLFAALHEWLVDPPWRRCLPPASEAAPSISARPLPAHKTCKRIPNCND